MARVRPRVPSSSKDQAVAQAGRRHVEPGRPESTDGLLLFMPSAPERRAGVPRVRRLRPGHRPAHRRRPQRLGPGDDERRTGHNGPPGRGLRHVARQPPGRRGGVQHCHGRDPARRRGCRAPAARTAGACGTPSPTGPLEEEPAPGGGRECCGARRRRPEHRHDGPALHRPGTGSRDAGRPGDRHRAGPDARTEPTGRRTGDHSAHSPAVTRPFPAAAADDDQRTAATVPRRNAPHNVTARPAGRRNSCPPGHDGGPASPEHRPGHWRHGPRPLRYDGATAAGARDRRRHEAGHVPDHQPLTGVDLADGGLPARDMPRLTTPAPGPFGCV